MERGAGSRQALTVALALGGCTPHEREHGLLSSAPAQDPMRNVEMFEDNPTFAAAQGGGFEVTCNASLRRAMLMVFQNDDTKSLGDYAREMAVALEKNGYVGARDTVWTEPAPQVRRGTVRVPALDAQPAVELMIEMHRFRGVLLALVFEALPADFARLELTLRASAETLRVSPP